VPDFDVPTGLQNLREVSGQTSAAGGRVRRRALLRSDAPAESDPAPALPGWPPATVVDLRSASEYSGAHPLAELGATIHRIPLSRKLNVLEFDGEQVLRESGLPGLYRYTMAGAEAAIVEAVNAVAHAALPVLVHCTFGKDRTGIVVATILAAVGVTEGAIVADYVETSANVGRIIARLTSLNSPTLEGIQDLLDTYPEGLDATADAIGVVLRTFEEAGGVEHWLRRHGLTDATLAALRSRLLETGAV
jgi:protein-tyrosine phosphatase